MFRLRESGRGSSGASACWLTALIILGGCSGHKLPEPRLPDDDEEQTVEAPAAPTPSTALAGTPAPAPDPATAPAAPLAEEPASSPSPAVSPAPSAASSMAVGSAGSVEAAEAAGPANSQTSPSKPGAAARTVQAVRPGNSLTASERRAHTIACLETIAGALARYWTRNKRFPDSYYHVDDQPYLSWRVELLPYLGYEKLYRKFDYREPWDGENNRRLLAEIPPVYRSPERGDERTNFVLAVGQPTAYVAASGPRVEMFPDGLENTILLVEADESRAVPWTKPGDLPIDLDEPRSGVFSLREDSLFAIMANSAVRQIPSSLDESQLAALWTSRGGEPANALEWTVAPTESVDAKLAAAFRESRQLAGAPSPDTASPGTTASGPTNPVAGTSGEPNRMPLTSRAGSITGPDDHSPSPPLPPVPAETEIQQAEVLIKQVYGDRYTKAKTESERCEIARTMLSEADSVRHELPAYFTQLRIARDIATNQGDLPSAVQAVRRLESNFAIDVVKERLTWIETANKFVKSTSDAELLADQAAELCEIALVQDAFDAGRKAQGLVLSLARRANDLDRIAAAQRFRERLDLARKEHGRIAGQLHALLRTPRDPQANFEVGKYLWLFKQKWLNGAEYLSLGLDGPWKQAAVLELQRPADPETQSALGDLYWTLSESSEFSQSTATLRNRAAQWYRLALAQHPEGLRKTLIQERVRVAEESDEQDLRKPT